MTPERAAAWAQYDAAWQAYARIVSDPIHWAEYREVRTYEASQRLTVACWIKACAAWDVATPERAAYDRARAELDAIDHPARPA